MLQLEEVKALLAKEFPLAVEEFGFESLSHANLQAGQMGRCVISLEPQARHLRPGGTVSGPTLFTMCDVAAYICVLGHIGPKALAVTTNANLDFMRKPAPERLLCRMTLLKHGKSLAVMEGRIFAEHSPKLPMVRANMTFAIPPK